MGVKGKFYNMKECFDACGDDDAPFIEGVYNSSAKNTKKQLMRFDDHRPGINQALSDKWQIKRAEPKILTYVEIFQKLDEYRSTGIGEYSRCETDEAIKIADKNGQLREYYRAEQVELREAVLGNAEYDELERLVKNLKPPVTE